MVHAFRLKRGCMGQISESEQFSKWIFQCCGAAMRRIMFLEPEPYGDAAKARKLIYNIDRLFDLIGKI
jgi:hypothetical protein